MQVDENNEMVPASVAEQILLDAGIYASVVPRQGCQDDDLLAIIKQEHGELKFPEK